MMMVTIVMAIILELEDKLGFEKTRRFSVGLLLGTAYSASIGGIATLVGTPPNMSFIRIFEIQFPDGPDISFAGWFFFALPITLIMLAVAWCLLYFLYMPKKGEVVIDREILQRQHRELGRLSFAEWIVLADFAALVLLWLFRSDIDLGFATIPGWAGLFKEPGFFNDGTVAITLAVVLFVIPARNTGKGERILNWNTASRLPWNIVLLFGGGFALAKGFVDSGLSMWLGDQLKGAGDLNPYLLLTTICGTMTFVTELTSNTATTEMTLPVLAGLATAIQVNPLFLMIPMTISCSCAFMMPVATPPNAIIFGTQRLKISQMAKTGLALNLIGMGVIVLVMYLLGATMWDIDLGSMPDWANPP
jgi:sodium-dependent dicarboxylate transporter 2/3/5